MGNGEFKFDISEPTEKFKKHLGIELNERIILSAPFGAGKTYFLKEFFKANKNKYEVIHLFPVNYSVATNEDIFELIKYDILFELFGKPIEFEKIDFSVFDYLPFYLKNNKNSLAKIFTPLISLIPETGKPVGNFVDRLLDFTEGFHKHYSGVQIDDKSKAQKYLESFTEQIGSIYEENFYTQLICELIDQLRHSNKETVLIIDDLDRIDPEHIFRILNVLSAHMDVGQGDNKFNFDKIILVFDQNNVRNIFKNKYGADVDYTGYIDKYYSFGIFEFSNVKGLESDLHKIINSLNLKTPYIKYDSNKWFVEGLTYVFKKLVGSNKITTRKLLKNYGKSINTEIDRYLINPKKRYNEKQFLIITLAQTLLLVYDDWDDLLNAIKIIRWLDINEDMRDNKTIISITEECLLFFDIDNHKFKVGTKHTFTSNDFDLELQYEIGDSPMQREFYCRIDDHATDQYIIPNFMKILYPTLQMIHDKNILIKND